MPTRNGCAKVSTEIAELQRALHRAALLLPELARRAATAQRRADALEREKIAAPELQNGEIKRLRAGRERAQKQLRVAEDKLRQVLALADRHADDGTTVHPNELYELLGRVGS